MLATLVHVAHKLEIRDAVLPRGRDRTAAGDAPRMTESIVGGPRFGMLSLSERRNQFCFVKIEFVGLDARSASVAPQPSPNSGGTSILPPGRPDSLLD